MIHPGVAQVSSFAHVPPKCVHFSDEHAQHSNSERFLSGEAMSLCLETLWFNSPLIAAFPRPVQ